MILVPGPGPGPRTSPGRDSESLADAKPNRRTAASLSAAAGKPASEVSRGRGYHDSLAWASVGGGAAARAASVRHRDGTGCQPEPDSESQSVA